MTGGGNYKIRELSQNDVDNGGNIIILNDKLVAELVVTDNKYNIKQFGAIGDDTTDCTEAIQNCLDALPLWGTCYVPAGAYVISSGLTMMKRRKMIGESFTRDDCYPFGASSIRLVEGANNVTMMTIVGNSNKENRAAIKYMTFNAKSSKTVLPVSTNATESAYTLSVTDENVNGIDMGGNSHLCVLEQVSVNNCSGIGIILGGCSVNRAVYVFGCGTGIVCSIDSILTDFYVWGCNYGVTLKIGCRLSTGRIEEICRHAIYIDDNSAGARLSEVTVDQIGYAAIAITDTGLLARTIINIKMSRCCQYYYMYNIEDLLALTGDNIVYEAFGQVYISDEAQISTSEIIGLEAVGMSYDDTHMETKTKFVVVNKSQKWWYENDLRYTQLKCNRWLFTDIIDTSKTGVENYQSLLNAGFMYNLGNAIDNKFGHCEFIGRDEVLSVSASPYSSGDGKISFYNNSRINHLSS